MPAASGTSQQHQTSASNDGLNASAREGSIELQHAAASVNAQGTVVEEELPVSDAETDLSSVGFRHSAQGGQFCTAHRLGRSSVAFSLHACTYLRKYNAIS